MSDKQAQFDPNQPGDLFEPVGVFDESKIGNVVECKACARTVPSTQAMMARHAFTEKTVAGKRTTCGGFWGMDVSRAQSLGKLRK